MFGLNQLEIPIVGAPMAGGPSTPALAAAVTNAGGLGFLAAGNKPADAVAAEIEQTRALTDGPFGLNIFVPDSANESASPSDASTRRAAVEEYRRRITGPAIGESARLRPGSGDGAASDRAASDGAASDRAASDGAAGDRAASDRAASDRDAAREDAPSERLSAAGAVDPDDDDGWSAKLELARHLVVPVVSFTFGLPSVEVIGTLQSAGIVVSVTVTDASEAAGAVRNGANVLCVQGPLAGGHRGTHSLDKAPGSESLSELIRAVRAVCAVPIIAAGGIARPEDMAAALSAGADAVQVGTMLLRSPEAGTSAVHRAAMVDSSFTETTVTRAFSGRWARGITNDFIRQHTAYAPAAYPEVNQLTRPLRSAAARAGDPQKASLWASPYFAAAGTDPAAQMVQYLAGLTRGH